MAKKVPEEVIEFARKRREEYKTLEEIQKEIEDKYGMKVSINTLSRRIRRFGEKRVSVLLTPTEQQVLKERFGSVGRGIRQAVKDALHRYELPEDEITKLAYVNLRNEMLAQEREGFTWQEMLDILNVIGIKGDEAVKKLQELQRMGYIVRIKGGEYHISERRRSWIEMFMG